MTSNVRLPLASSPSASPASAPADSSTQVVADAPGSAPNMSDLMQIGDLARDAGKTVRAIHLYEELGLLRPAGRSKGRFRLYGPDALVRIRWIGKMQDLGFSLPDIQGIVREWEELGSAPRAMVQMRDAYRRKLEETRGQIKKLAALAHEVEASLLYLDTCEVCDPDRLLSACSKCDRHECGEEPPELVAGFHAHPS
jgi:MerR family transcriptional regulator, copper efflux regulator